MHANINKPAAWTPTKVPSLYRYQNRSYYVRIFAGGKEKWTSLKTTLLSVAKYRIKEHLDAAEPQKSPGEAVPAMGTLTFGEVTEAYRQQLQASEVRPNTTAYRDAGIELVFKSCAGFADIIVRRITSRAVEDWLRRFTANAKPDVPVGRPLLRATRPGPARPPSGAPWMPSGRSSTSPWLLVSLRKPRPKCHRGRGNAADAQDRSPRTGGTRNRPATDPSRIAAAGRSHPRRPG